MVAMTGMADEIPNLERERERERRGGFSSEQILPKENVANIAKRKSCYSVYTGR